MALPVNNFFPNISEMVQQAGANQLAIIQKQQQMKREKQEKALREKLTKATATGEQQNLLGQLYATNPAEATNYLDFQNKMAMGGQPFQGEGFEAQTANSIAQYLLQTGQAASPLEARLQAAQTVMESRQSYAGVNPQSGAPMYNNRSLSIPGLTGGQPTPSQGATQEAVPPSGLAPLTDAQMNETVNLPKAPMPRAPIADVANGEQPAGQQPSGEGQRYISLAVQRIDAAKTDDEKQAAYIQTLNEAKNAGVDVQGLPDMLTPELEDGLRGSVAQTPQVVTPQPDAVAGRMSDYSTTTAGAQERVKNLETIRTEKIQSIIKDYEAKQEVKPYLQLQRNSMDDITRKGDTTNPAVSALLEPVAFLQGVGDMLGMDIDFSKTSSLQDFRASAQRLVIPMIKSYGGNPTETEGKKVADMMASLDKTPESNYILMDLAEQASKQSEAVMKALEPKDNIDPMIDYDLKTIKAEIEKARLANPISPALKLPKSPSPKNMTIGQRYVLPSDPESDVPMRVMTYRGVNEKTNSAMFQ
jgi:hypothetical protein